MNKTDITTEVAEKKAYISFRGLKLYTSILIALIAVFIYLQVNGTSIFSDSNTEHEGNTHSYSSRHHK